MTTLFLADDLFKGRHAKHKYVAIYEITPKTGSNPYERRFYNTTELNTFLTNAARRGIMYRRIDTDGSAPRGEAVAVEKLSDKVLKPIQPVSPTVTASDVANTEEPPKLSEVMSLAQERYTGSKLEPQLVDLADVANARINATTKIAFTRLGDELATLDSNGWQQGMFLHQTNTKVDELKEEIAALRTAVKKLDGDMLDETTAAIGNKTAELHDLLKERDRVREEFLKRPLSWKITRVIEVEGEMRKLRAADRKERKENPTAWAKVLSDWQAQTRAAKRKKQALPDKPTMFQHNLLQLSKLKFKLKGIKGKTQAIILGNEKSKGTLSRIESVNNEGISPDDGEVSYLLSLGKLDAYAPSGALNTTASTALLNEFSGIISNIVNGRVFKEKRTTSWKHLIPNFDDVKTELAQMARIKLLEIARGYTPDVAKEYRGSGVNFRTYAISFLNREMNKWVKQHIANQIRYGGVDAEVLTQMGSSLEHQESEHGDASFTSHQIRDEMPLESPYLTGEELLQIKDAQKILTTRIDKFASIAVLSRLNLYNPSDNPDAGRGLKSWDEVAADISAATGVSAQFAKMGAIRNVGDVFDKKHLPWVSTLTAAESDSLKSGIRLMIRAFGQRRAAVPGASSWKKNPEGTRSTPSSLYIDVHRKVHPQTKLTSRHGGGQFRVPGGTGSHVSVYQEMSNLHSTPLKLLSSMPKTVREFWQARSYFLGELGHEAVSRYAPFIDDHSIRGASALDNTGKPNHQQISTLRATHMMNMWKRVSKLTNEQLESVLSSKAYEKWSEKWADSETKLTISALGEGSPKVKRPAFSFGDVTVTGVSPPELASLIGYVRQEKKFRAVHKAKKKVDAVLVALLKKLAGIIRKGK